MAEPRIVTLKMLPETLVTGGTGMVGRNLQSLLPKAKYYGSEYNLMSPLSSYLVYLNTNRVIHLAAKVGGIKDNMIKQYDYFYQNIMMNTMLMEEARRLKIKRFTAILSTCIYPDVAKHYPMTEDMMHDSPPAISNYGYAIAKRALASGIDCCNQQYGTQYNYIIPCNLYGYWDKYGDNSHYVAALIKKIDIAKMNGDDHITLMGDGKPLRQFMFAEDLARILALCVEKDITESFNVATDELYTIDQIARIALKACNAKHLKIKYKNKNLSGQYRKDCDTTKFKKIFPDFKFTSLEEGIRKTYKHYKKHSKHE